MYPAHDGGGSGLLIAGFERHDVSSGTISAQADSVATPAGDVENVNADLTAKHNTAKSGVAGVIAVGMDDAPAATKKQALQLVQGMTVAAGALRSFSTAVETFDSTISGLNSQIAAEETREDQVDKKATLSGQHAGAVETLQTAAKTTEGQLSDPLNPDYVSALWAAGALPSYSPGLFGADFNLKPTNLTTLPSDLAAMTDSELRDYFLEHPEQAALYMPVIPESVKTLIGQEIARRADAVTNPDDLGPVSERAKRLEALNDVLTAFGSDPVVATSFMNELGPKGLLELNMHVALSMQDISDRGSMSEMFDEDVARTIQSIQQHLGTSLAAATAAIPPSTRWAPSDPGGADHVSTEWVNGLLDAGKSQFEVPREYTVPGYVWGYQLLSPMLGDGDYSSDFLTRVGTDMLRFEQGYAADNHGHLPWYGGSTDKPMITTSPMSQDVRLDWSDGWEDSKNGLGFDPVTGLMEGLSHDPEASRDVLTSTMTYSDGQQSADLVDYLVHERDWRPDSGYAGPTKDYPTGLPELGDALIAATTGDGANYQSTAIVETLVHSTYDRLDQDDPGKFATTDAVHPELRTDLAEIAAAWMPSVHNSYGSNPEGNGLPDYVFDDADLFESGEDGKSTLPLDLFLAEVAKDADGRDVVSAASNAWTLESMARGLETAESPDDIERVVTGAVNRSSSVLGAVGFGASTEIAEDAAQADARHNANVDLGISAGKTLFGLTPAGKLPGAGFVLDQVTSGLADALHTDSTGSTNVIAGTLFSNQQEDQKALIRDAIWFSIPDDHRPEGLSSSVDLDNLTSAQQDAYDDWVATDPWGQELDARTTDGGQKYTVGLQNAEDHLQKFGSR